MNVLQVNCHPTSSYYSSTIVGRVDLAVIGIVHRKVRVTSPRREWVRFTTTASHSEGEDKHHDLSATIHCRGDKIIVLDEQPRMVLADVKLADESQDEEHGQRAVDADEQVAHVPQDDRGVEVAPVLVAGEAEGEVGWDWYDEAEEEGESDPFVAGADAEHVLGYAPGNGERVELLHVLSGPDVGALDGLQDLALVLDDRDHHNPVCEAVRNHLDPR